MVYVKLVICYNFQESCNIYRFIGISYINVTERLSPYGTE